MFKAIPLTTPAATAKSKHPERGRVLPDGPPPMTSPQVTEAAQLLAVLTAP